MTRKERDLLHGLIDEIRDSDDQIEPLIRLYNEVKSLITV